MALFKVCKKVLIIEDDEELVQFMQSVLERVKYTVSSITKGIGVLELAISFKPDLIILDTLLPDLDGSEVERRLKADSATSHIPILYLSGLLSMEDEKKSQHYGSKSRMLTKPVTTERLIESVTAMLSD